MADVNLTEFGVITGLDTSVSVNGDTYTMVTPVEERRGLVVAMCDLRLNSGAVVQLWAKLNAADDLQLFEEFTDSGFKQYVMVPRIFQWRRTTAGTGNSIVRMDIMRAGMIE